MAFIATYVQLTDLLDDEAEAVPRIGVGEAFVDDGAAGAHLVREGLGGQQLFGREVAVHGGGATPARRAISRIGTSSPSATNAARAASRMRSRLSRASERGTFSADTVPAADRRAVRAAQFEAAGRGELAMVVHEVLPVEQAWPAHQKMDAGEVSGRIVLVPGGHAWA